MLDPQLLHFFGLKTKSVFNRLGIRHCERKLLYSIGSGREKCLIKDAVSLRSYSFDGKRNKYKKKIGELSLTGRKPNNVEENLF